MLATVVDGLENYPTLFVSGLPPTITELDLVKVLTEMKMEVKVMIERDPVTSTPLGRIKLIFRYLPDAERFYATVNGSPFLGSKVHLTFKDPNMNFSNTSGAKAIVVKHIPLGVTSLEFYESVRGYGRIISCKVMIDRSGTESYALLQFENQDHADKCLAEMNGSQFRGNVISLSWQFPKNSPYQYPTVKTTSPTPRVSGPPSAGINGPMSPSATSNWQQRLSSNFSGWTQPDAPATGWAPSPVMPAPGSSGWPSAPTTGWSPAAGPQSQSPPPPQWQNGSSPQPGWNAPAVSTSPVNGVATGWHNTNNSNNSNGTISPSPVNGRNGWESSPATSPVPDNTALDDKNLYVKNLEEHIDNLELFNMFRKFGRIISARVMRDDNTGRSKGFGFVSYESSDQAARAMREMNGKRYGTKNLVVNVAEPKGYRQSKLAQFHATKTGVVN